MAIEEYGESLLSNVRQRRDTQSRQMRKQQEKQALLGLGLTAGVAVGNQYLKNKAQAFFNDEDNLKKRVQFRSAMAGSSQTLMQEQKFQQKGMSYFRDQVTAEATRYAKDAAYKVNPNYSETALAQITNQYVDQLADQRYQEHLKRLEIAKRLVTASGEDGVDAYDRALLKTQSQSIPEAFLKKLGSVFTGDAEADMHTANLDKLGAEASEYMKVYKKTNNPFLARELVESELTAIASSPLTPNDITIKNYYNPNTFETEDITVREYSTKTGQIVRRINLSTGQPLEYNPRFAGNNPFNPNRLKPAIAEAAMENMRMYGGDAFKEVENAFVDSFKGTAGKTIKDVDSKVRESRYRTFGATGHILHQAVSENMRGLNLNQQWAVATKMAAMNYTSDLDFDLISTNNGYNPVLAIAALDNLGNVKRSGISRNLANRLIGEVASNMGRDVVQNFNNQDMVQRQRFLYWMKDNAPFFANTKIAGQDVTYLEYFRDQFVSAPQ
jgi:hypothetical protein